MSSAEQSDFFIFSECDWQSIVNVVRQTSLATPTFAAPLVPKKDLYVRSITFSGFNVMLDTDVGQFIIGKSLKTSKSSINIDKVFNLKPKSINRYAQRR